MSGEGDRQADGAGPSQQGGAGWEQQLLNTLAPAEVLAKAASPRYPPQQLHFLQMLAAKDPAILASFGASPQVGRRLSIVLFIYLVLVIVIVIVPT